MDFVEKEIRHKLKIKSYAALLLFVLFLSGCQLTTTVFIKNKSGQDIDITSSNTGNTVNIRNDETKEILHGYGTFVIKTSDGNIWNYDVLSVMEVKDKKYRYYKKKLFGATLHIYLLINQNGEICILPLKDKKLDVCPLVQPQNYPLKPI